LTLPASLIAVTRLFIDSAPVVCYVEQQPFFSPLLESTFQAIETGSITGVQNHTLYPRTALE
jgi:hypothetical protein